MDKIMEKIADLLGDNRILIAFVIILTLFLSSLLYLEHIGIIKDNTVPNQEAGEHFTRSVFFWRFFIK